MIEWGQNQNPNKSLGLPTKPKKIPGPKINPKKSNADFLSLENSQKRLMIIIITQKKTLEIECLCLFIHHTI